MDQHFRSVFRDFLAFSLVAFLICLAAGLLLQTYILAIVTAYVLSFLFVGSNFLVIRKIRKEDASKFYWQFFTSLGVRFLLVIAALIAVLKTTKIHEIYFTVSFIISYILHSVIEIIAINKILETDN